MKKPIDLYEENNNLDNLNVDILLNNIEFEKGNVYSIIARLNIEKNHTIARMIASNLALKGMRVLYINIDEVELSEMLETCLSGHEMVFDFDNDCLWCKNEYVTMRKLILTTYDFDKIPTNYDLYIIDYFQAIKSPRNRKYISQKLQEFAKSRQVPIIVLSHLPQSVELRKNKIPRVTDMTKKMCGDLRKVSKTIIALYSDGFYGIRDNIDKTMHFYIYN